jgi:hypothetical protein
MPVKKGITHVYKAKSFVVRILRYSKSQENVLDLVLDTVSVVLTLTLRFLPLHLPTESTLHRFFNPSAHYILLQQKYNTLF